MSAQDTFIKKLKKRFDAKQDEIYRIPGILGDGNGNLYPLNLSGFVYVIIGDKALPVFNNRVAGQYGVKVWVGYAPEEPTLFQVLSTRSESPNGGNVNGLGYAPAKRYEWLAPGGGQDPLQVHLRALTTLKIGISSLGGMFINLFKGRVFNSFKHLTVATQDIDLTAHIPATAGKAALVLITINRSGTVVQTKGNEVDIDALVLSDLPNIPENTAWISGAVRVYNGQTSIQEGRVNTDIVDLRLMNDANTYSILSDWKNPTGWIDNNALTVEYDATARTITLTGDLRYYWHGQLHELISPWTSDAHDAGDGRFYLYSVDGVNFSWSTTVWNINDGDVLIAATTVHNSGADKFGLSETHGMMGVAEHEHFHQTIGTIRASGGGPTAGTYTENTASDAATTPGFDEAIIEDEDNTITIPAWAQGIYTTMRVGVGGLVVFDTATSFPFRSSGSYVFVNDPSDGGETAAGNNDYVNVYQILIPVTDDTNSQMYRMVMLQPQNVHATLADAQAENPALLDFGDFTGLLDEFVFYTRITYIMASGDANVGKCRIATGGISYVTVNALTTVIGTGQAVDSVNGLTGSVVLDYDDISAYDPTTDVTGAELQELTDGSQTTLHTHDYEPSLPPSDERYFWRGDGAWSNILEDEFIMTDTDGNYGYSLKGRWSAVTGAAVPVFRATTADTPTALDIAPKGTVTTDQLGTGISWLHVVDEDVIDNPSAGYRAAGVVIRSDAAAFGSSSEIKSTVQARIYGPVIGIANAISQDSSFKLIPYTLSPTGLNGGVSLFTLSTGASTWGTYNWGMYVGYVPSLGVYTNRILVTNDAMVTFGYHTAGVTPTTQSSFTDVMAIVMSTGNVGINNLTPQAKLSIGNSFTPYTGVLQTLSNPAADTYIQMGKDATENLFFGWKYDSTPANMYGWVATYGYTRDLRLDGNDVLLQTNASGNVGIGITGPSSKLEVNGDIGLHEMTAPGTPVANTAILYLVDDGDGTQTAYIKFDNGTAVPIASN